LVRRKLDRDKQTVDSHLLLQIVGGQICHSIRPFGFVFCFMGIVNKRTMEEGLWGMWAFRPDKK
jgi:hypothetical protein